jgi:hypothetical protein
MKNSRKFIIMSRCLILIVKDYGSVRGVQAGSKNNCIAHLFLEYLSISLLFLESAKMRLSTVESNSPPA